MLRHLLLATLCVSVLSCTEGASAHLTDVSATQSTDERDLSNDAEVFVTVGSDAVPHFTQQLLARSGSAALVSVAGSNRGISALRLRESQLGTLGAVIHDAFHRCGGFELHDTEADALQALAPVTPHAAAAFSYSLDNAAVVQKLMGSLAVSNILAVDNALSAYKNRYYSAQTGADAANWLKGQWQTLAQGRADITVETFTHAAFLQPSVILTITGKTSPAEVVVLGAHVDSINVSNTAGVAPGADDDASGVATLTEVIRSIVANDFHPARTVKFMAYAAEEVGLRGSKEIAAKYKATGVNVVGVMQLDMTNYKGSANDIVLFTDYTNAAQNQFLGALIDTYVKVARSTSSCGYACSDHASWDSNGYPTSMPFESLMSNYNPFIHTENDTLAQSSGTVDNSLKFAKMAAAYVAELAKGSTGGSTSTDTVPPTVALTSPAANAKLSGTAPVTASASDDVAVARVDFALDGTLVQSDTSAPYAFDWVTSGVTNGTHRLTAKAFDGSGNSASTADLVVEVANAGNALAVYDTGRKAPACAPGATGCDSGTLLSGRGPVGPELNKPNTLAGSCADGASGKFHVDESIDRLVISSADGAVLGKGKQAKLDVTIWAYSSFTNDALDLYAADDAASPKWTLIGTLTPKAGGAQTLSTTFTLSSGATQAIRAHLRYKGTVGPCGAGAYDDHDDLVFSVQ